MRSISLSVSRTQRLAIGFPISGEVHAVSARKPSSDGAVLEDADLPGVTQMVLTLLIFQ